MPKVPKKQKTMSDLFEIMNKHFEDDETAFGGINKKLDKREEIAIINGEHLSHIGARLKNIEDRQTEQATINKTILEHITEVKPILQNYKDTQATKRVLAGYGKGIVLIGAIIGAWVAIKQTLF